MVAPHFSESNAAATITICHVRGLFKRTHAAIYHRSNVSGRQYESGVATDYVNEANTSFNPFVPYCSQLT